MKKSELKELLLRYSVGKCTKEEMIWVENWYILQETDDSLPISEKDFLKHLEVVYCRLLESTTSQVIS